MLPYTRIMVVMCVGYDEQSWSTMIGMETRIAAKLYRVTMKNGKSLREKFEKVLSDRGIDDQNPDAPTEGNEKTILDIPNAVKGSNELYGMISRSVS